MTQTLTTIGIQLSTHEIWGLMRLMRLPGIPGMPLPSQDELSDDALRAAEQLALDSLRARGLIQLKNEGESATLIIDKTAGALLGAGALCNYWITLSVQPVGAARQDSYIYFGPHLSVIHSQPQSHIHLLSAATSGDILFSAIYSGLALDNKNTSTGTFSWIFDQEFLEAITNESDDDAAYRLADIGMARPDIKRFMMAIRGPKRYASRQEMQTSEITGIEILMDDTDYFLCVPGQDGIHIETVNTPAVIDAVKQFIH